MIIDDEMVERARRCIGGNEYYLHIDVIRKALEAALNPEPEIAVSLHATPGQLRAAHKEFQKLRGATAHGASDYFFDHLWVAMETKRREEEGDGIQRTYHFRSKDNRDRGHYREGDVAIEDHAHQRKTDK